MQCVFQSTSVNEARIVKSILDENDIECIIRNEILQSITGAVGIVTAWPEVWVVKPGDFDAASVLVKGRDTSDTLDWVCHKCGENIDGEFDACWKCGELKSEPVSV